MMRGLAALGLLAGLAAPAAAECRLAQITAPGVFAVYDPFDASFTPSPVPLAVQVAGECAGARVELAVAATLASPRTGSRASLVQGAATLAATVLAAGQPRPIVPAGAAFTTNPLSLPIGATGQVQGDASLALALDPGQVAPPGLYTATLDLVARLTDAQGRQTLTSLPLSLQVSVKPSTRIAAGTGDLLIDLGELTPGAIGGPVGFDAYANVDYSLILRSENGFVLRREGAAAGSPGVPYTPLLAAGALDAGGQGATARQALFQAPASGIRRHLLRVKVGSFTGLPAARYGDVLTLEIRARI